MFQTEICMDMNIKGCFKLESKEEIMCRAGNTKPILKVSKKTTFVLESR